MTVTKKADHSKIISVKTQLPKPVHLQVQRMQYISCMGNTDSIMKCLFINHQAENKDHNSHTKHKKSFDKFWLLLYPTVCHFHNLISTITKISRTFTMIKCVNKVAIIKKNIHHPLPFKLKLIIIIHFMGKSVESVAV